MMDFLKTAALTVTAFSMATAGFPCLGQKIDDAAIFRRIHRDMKAVVHGPDTASIVFLGDVMLHDAQIRNASEKYMNSGKTDTNSHYSFDFSQYFSDIQEYISEADIAVANMEFTLGGPPFSGYPAFSSPDGYAEYMAGCGIDVFLTANNHILDKGPSGAERTIGVYENLQKRYGTRYTGSACSQAGFKEHNPLVIDITGVRAAFINFTYGTNIHPSAGYPKVNRTDREQLLLQMQRAEESGADIVIALPHWGEEYSLTHSGQQLSTAAWLAENGADIIIGSHPHVVQDSTVINVRQGRFAGKKVPVIFSLGNAISNMSAPNTQIGLMVMVKAVKHMNGKTELLPIEFTYLWSSLPGRLKDTHCTIPVKEYIGSRKRWLMPYEYDKMVDSYIRVKTETGIKDF